MTTNNIEQLQKEIEERKAAIAAEQAKLDEQRAEAERIEREHKAEIEREERKRKMNAQRAKYMADANKIVEALHVQGFTKAVVTETDGREFPDIHPGGTDKHGIPVVFEWVYNRDSWRSRITGLRVRVGDTYVEGSKRFPQRKSGDFNYDGIAKTYKEMYDVEVAKTQRNNREKLNAQSNKQRIARLTNKYGTPAYKGADYNRIPEVEILDTKWHGQGANRSYTVRPDNVLMLHIDRISEENADKLLAFMKTEGMLDKEGKQ